VLGDQAFYERLTAHPDLWHPRKGPILLAREGLPLVLRPLYDIVSQFKPQNTLIVGASSAIGARLVHEKLGTPMVTVYLQPGYLGSVYETPRMSGLPWLYRAPRPVKRWVYRQIATYFDKLIGEPLNALRRELHLQPIAPASDDWLNSPQRIVGLFPSWFAAPQPDWPQQTRLTGFVLALDAESQQPLSPALLKFLDAGTPPIIFTLGSGMRRAHRFFAESVEVCRLLGKRGIFVTRYKEQLPATLPQNVLHIDHAPFGVLFSRSAALVYNGGIGTLCQSLASALPQLVVPLSHDQFDNAARVKRLQVADSLSYGRYNARRAAQKLERLSSSPQVKDAQGEWSLRIASEQATKDTCALIEQAAT
jgi:UDP:flavonoid glycosyltransferase YjiC (YdhE family)